MNGDRLVVLPGAILSLLGFCFACQSDDTLNTGDVQNDHGADVLLDAGPDSYSDVTDDTAIDVASLDATEPSDASPSHDVSQDVALDGGEGFDIGFDISDFDADEAPDVKADAEIVCEPDNPCASGFSCDSDLDCISTNCVDGECQAPTCDDGIKNGDETDVDCGGSDCPPCEISRQCELDSDCVSSVACYEGTCDPFCGGSGDSDDPWLICNPEAYLGLLLTDQFVEDAFLVTQALDMSELDDGAVNAVAMDWTFRGEFDGGLKPIENFTMELNTNNAGFFPQTGSAVIKNVTIVDADVSAVSRVGVLVGNNSGSEIRNCHVSGTARAVGGGPFSSARMAGVLVGSTGGEIVDSSSAGHAEGDEGRVGGLVGELYNGQIRRSFSTATVSSEEGPVGGLVGTIGGLSVSDTKIEYSYATGDVAGGWQVGGLVGEVSAHMDVLHSYATGSATADIGSAGGAVGDLRGTITHSYSTGTAEGASSTGGFVGVDGRANTFSQNIVEHNYWNIETSGNDTSPVGEGLTTEEFGDESSFDESWIFEPDDDFVWTMPDGGPPSLWWQ